MAAQIFAFPTFFGPPVQQIRRSGRYPKTIATLHMVRFNKWHAKHLADKRQALIDKHRENELVHLEIAKDIRQMISCLLSEQQAQKEESWNKSN